MSDKIREALAKLDISNDDHWTTEGLPRLDVMKDLVGEPVTRADITSAAKGFSRKTPNLEIEQPENTGSGEAADAQAETPETTEDTSQTPTEAPEESSDDEDVDAPAEVEEPEEGSDEAVEAELESATDALYKAQARHKAATEAMDVVIARRAAKEAGRTTAHDIKAYQQSQAKQREAMAQRRKLMTDALAATKEQF